MARHGGLEGKPGRQVWAAPAQPGPQSCKQAGCPVVPVLTMSRPPVPHPSPGKAGSLQGWGLLPEPRCHESHYGCVSHLHPRTETGWGGRLWARAAAPSSSAQLREPSAGVQVEVPRLGGRCPLLGHGGKRGWGLETELIGQMSLPLPPGAAAGLPLSWTTDHPTGPLRARTTVTKP